MADRRRCARRAQRGSTLLLFPAGFMVLMILAAIAVDLSSLHLARRELVRTVAQAADDASAMLDPAAVRSGDLGSLDAGAARRLATYEILTARLNGRIVGEPKVTVDRPTGTVTVEAALDVPRVFGAAIPGIARTRRIVVRASGRLVDVG